ncbi:D-2-hydroxyacid dehydrogenase [Natronorubrum sp. FCH18a]|uniref:D-2-hydroxyacid dehydrogenase n=1 Tax=Natronorubrum sp. FCH18a TaxID=3447018 RepID=UPI003F51211F
MTTNNTGVDIAVLRRGTEGLSTDDYATQISNRLPDSTVRLARTPKEEREIVTNAQVVTGVSLDKQQVMSAERLELFACIFSGIDHLPIESLQEQGVTVTNASGIHSTGIAEQVLGKILVFARNLHEGWKRTQNHEWRHYQASELCGSTVTIVGLGSVGQEIAKRLRGFDVHTIGARYTPEKGGPTDEVISLERDELHDALARTEYLVLACPLTDETRHLISREELITLPPNAVLINVARGGVVDTDALIWALRDESIRGAAMDVTEPEPLSPDHPLWYLENVLITPHMAGHTPKHWDRLVDILEHNVRALDGNNRGSMRNIVLSKDDGVTQYVNDKTDR